MFSHNDYAHNSILRVKQKLLWPFIKQRTMQLLSIILSLIELLPPHDNKNRPFENLKIQTFFILFFLHRKQLVVQTKVLDLFHLIRYIYAAINQGSHFDSITSKS